MAKGGSGDALAGMITAFAARGMSTKDAAVLAVGIHSMAGDAAMRKADIESVTASGIIQNIPSVFGVLRKH
jgi:NAD(P)H-hydrate epimerase